MTSKFQHTGSLKKAMKNYYEKVFKKETIIEHQKVNPFIKLNDVVYDCIKEAIDELKIQPGEKLNINEIAKQLDVSITPVKNASLKLMEEGRIEYRTGKNAGYYVFDVNEKELTDIYDTRKCYEGFAAFLCAQRLILVNLDHLQELAEEHKRLWLDYADGDDSYDNFNARLECDMRFHEMLVRYSDNAMLYKEYMKNKKNFEYTLRRSLNYWKIDKGVYGKKIMAGQHLNIVNGIATGIPEIARKASEDHVQSCKTQCFLRRNRQCLSGYRD